MTTPTVMMRPIHRPSWFEAPSNVILAAVVLCAIRLGRHSLEEQQRMRFGSQVDSREEIHFNEKIVDPGRFGRTIGNESSSSASKKGKRK